MSVLKDISAAEIRSDLEKPPAFGHFADLTNRRVTEPLDLSGLTLCGFDFSGSRFESDVCFDDATLKGISWFRSTHFEAEADFRSVCFFNDARFDGAGFARNGRFCRAEFRGIATFDACSAQSELDFSDCLANGNFSIAGASLQQKAVLTGAVMMGGFWRRGMPDGRFTGLDRSTIFGRLSGKD